MPNIFLVEDDRAIAKNLTLLLRSEDFSVIHAPTREEALTALAGDPFDLALIDISLPDGNGFTVYTEIKAAREIPVIFLTASGDEASVVTGLNMGADDYITKPFGNQELLARIRTALRHRRQPMGAETKTPMYHAGQLKIDFDKRRVFLGEEEIRLTQIEYKLVSLLAENAGKVITYESIIKDIWGPHADTNNRILRVNMANIRRKIEKNPAVPKYVFTEVGVGYRMLENELNS